MRAASKPTLALIGVVAALAACRQAPTDQNMAVDNQAAAPAEIEALPPDESAATPTNQLVNGDDVASNVDEPTNSD